MINFWIIKYGTHKGLKLFKHKGDEGMKTEMQQIHDRDVMQPVPYDSLNAEQRSMALKYLMFLKQKRDGKIKGRGCADERNQRGRVKKK